MALTFTASSSLLAQHSGSYTVDRLDREVYYENVFVRGADASTFVDLGYGYGKDRNHVYRFGEVLEYVDPSSFRVSSEFASDEAYGHMRPGYGGDCCHDGYGQYDNGGYYKTNFADSTTTAVIIKPILMCFLEAGRYPMPMCPVLRFWETGTPRTHFMYTGVEKYSTTPVRRLSRSPVTAMPRMLSTHISMAAKYADSIYG